MEKPTVNTRKGTLMLIEPGIIKLVLKENAEWNLEDAKETHKANLELSKGQKFCVLLNASRFFIPTNEANAYIASKECTEHRIGAAFVVKNPGMQLLGNLFLRTFKSKSATRIFKTEEAALKWLRGLYKDAMKN
jgi:hypothetical protein